MIGFRTWSLGRMWERIRTVPGLGRNVTAVAVIGALGAASGAGLLSQMDYTWPWADRFEFAADFAQAPGIDPEVNPEVRIAGVPVGKIVESEPTSEGNARLTLSIEQGHAIYANAQLVLRPKNQLNEMYVEIDPGGKPANRLPEHAVIPVTHTERPIQVDEVLSHLDARTRTAMTNLLQASDTALAHAPRDLPRGLRATDSVLNQFRPVVEKLRTRRENIRELVTALADIAHATGRDDTRIARLVNSTEDTLRVMSHRSDDISAALGELPGVNDELRSAMTGTRDLTRQLNPTLDELRGASDELPPALRRMTGLMGQLGKTVDSAKPVVAKARPVAADLRPFATNIRAALDQFRPVTRNLDRDTSVLVPYMNDLGAFVYNTSSVFSLADANGGFERGHLTIAPSELADLRLPQRGRK